MTLASILTSPYRMLSLRSSSEDETSTGPELVTAEGKSLPLAGVSLVVDAGGGIARSVLEHTFVNDAGGTDEALHVTYKMPLPADGAVSGYEFTIGARTIRGHVLPKHDARERFVAALAEGRTAGILEQERADLFTQEIGNVPPGATIVARITIDQPLAWLAEGEWELRFPTVIGPRYVGPSDPEEVASAVAVKTATPGAIEARLALEVRVRDELAPGGRVTSPSHRCAPRDGGFALRRLGDKLDRDIVVRWPVAKREVGVSLLRARPAGDLPHGHLAYGLVTVVPPEPASVAPTPRDLIVLLDTSGSMGGTPLAQAKRVIAAMIETLGESDRLELVEFSSEPRAWKKEPLAATAAVKKDALRWLNGLSAGGATEMFRAVIAALAALRPGAQRQVVLVTDGYIGGEERIIELCHERLPRGCRLHVVGVGAAPNRSLAKALSRAGRGAEVLVALDEDPERGAKRLLARTAAPVLTDVTVEGDAVVEVAPEHVPDVFAGAPLVCGVKLRPEGGAVVVRGTLAGAPWEARVTAPPTRAGEGDPAIVALFARESVADLESRWSIGREVAAIDRSIERIGTVFQIATRLTSFVAIDEVRSVDPASGSRRVTQPHELPHGTTLAGFGFAGGADGAMTTRSGAVGPEGMALMRALSRPTGAPAPLRMPAPVPGAGAPFAGPRTQVQSSDQDYPLGAAPSMMVAPAALPKRRRSRRWLAILLVLLVALLALAAYLWLRYSGA